MLDRLSNLRKISVFGCNRVTVRHATNMTRLIPAGSLPSCAWSVRSLAESAGKAGVAVVGQESSFSVRTL